MLWWLYWLKRGTSLITIGDDVNVECGRFTYAVGGTLLISSMVIMIEIFLLQVPRWLLSWATLQFSPLKTHSDWGAAIRAWKTSIKYGCPDSRKHHLNHEHHQHSFRYFSATRHRTSQKRIGLSSFMTRLRKGEGLLRRAWRCVITTMWGHRLWQ